VTRILVTGAAGMLGRDLVAAAAARELEIIAPTHDELDICDERETARAVAVARAPVVINCAAFNDVDGAERDEAAALAVNGDGPRNLAIAARVAGARLLHVSTDYVFDGTATQPYVESDATAPRSAYGRTKLAGERAVLAASPRHAVVRTAWLFGAGRGNFVSWVLECARDGRPITAFTDQFGCPTYTGHLADKLLDLAADERGGVFHAVAASHCSRFEFAQAILAAAGIDTQVTPTVRATHAADRPAWSVLASERDPRPLPCWRDGLSAYLAERKALA
jgi:dTDP-4-dehydrorhamnose reductase